MTAVLFTCAGSASTSSPRSAAQAPPRSRPTSTRSRRRSTTPTTTRSCRGSTTPATSRRSARPRRLHDVRLVVPLTDLDQEILARARDRGELGAVALLPRAGRGRARARQVPRARVLRGARRSTRRRPGSRTTFPRDVAFPVLVKARQRLRLARHLPRREPRAARLLPRATRRPTRWCRQCCRGEEFSIDVFCDLDGRCLNAIPRTMIESKGGESIKGMTIKDAELIEFGARVAETLRHRRAGEHPVLPRADGDRHQVTDVNPRFGGGFPLPTGGRAAAIPSSRSRSRAASGPSRGSAISARAS